MDKNSEYGAGARFIGGLPQNFSGTYQAVYPYGAGDFNSLTIPDVQTAKDGDFDQTAVIAVAESQTNTLEFKNVTSLLKFKVPVSTDDFKETITSVTITSDHALAGTIKIKSITPTADGTTIDYEVQTAKKSITINCTEGFDPTKTYYVAVLPGTKNNFVVRVNGYLSVNKESVNIKRSFIMNIPSLPAPEASTWTIKGSFTGGNNWGTPLILYKDLNNLALVKNVSGKTKEFKFNSKDTWLGGSFAVENKWCVTNADTNLKLPLDNCDIYFDTSTKFFTIVPVGGTVPEIQYLYLKPNNDWFSDGARFAVCFMNDNKNIHYWYSLIDTNADKIYECSIIPGGFTYVVFCRMKGSDSTNNWDNKWNQTPDLQIPSNGNNFFTITGWGSGTWSKK